MRSVYGSVLFFAGLYFLLLSGSCAGLIVGDAIILLNNKWDLIALIRATKMVFVDAPITFLVLITLSTVFFKLGNSALDTNK
jgi:hypothetical protein